MGGNQTTVVTTAGAGAAAVIVLWLLTFYQPALMEAAPAGLEGAIVVLFSAIFGWFAP
jgi:hypothetical protein